MKGLLARLNRHWFAPASLRDLALARIVIVGAQLFFFLPSLSDEHRFAQADPALFKPLLALKVLLFPLGGWGVRPSVTVLDAAWVGAVLSGIFGLLGFLTRPALLVFAVTNTLLQAHIYSYGEQHHSEALMIVALWVLAFAPAGAAWSLDDLRQRAQTAARSMRAERPRADEYQSPWARWPLRLVQWLFALVYFSAGLEKVAAGRLDWYNGYTIAYYMLQDGVNNNLPLSLMLAQHPRLLVIVSVGAAVFELGFFLAVLIPALALPFVAFGSAFHTGIWLLQRAPFFQFLALYSVFVEPIRKHWPRWLRVAPRASQPRWTVTYDGMCPLCLRTVTILGYLDLRERLALANLEDPDAHLIVPRTITPAALHTQIHLVDPAGRAYSGFLAFRALTRLLPPLWPIFPLVYLPGVTWLGSRAYSRIAVSRAHVPCRAASSSIT
jgi:predicted DCC family thiol-disulfide oxidoreductase YuxK/uncharacterized membrane protein YphA (DoxX/SURF4 family)